jgi:phosphatidylglycerol---prolipoprotein diacylglyceryl transferase
MYPVLFEVFGYPISTFGVMMAFGFLAATAITTRRMGEMGLDPDLATTMLLFCMGGGIFGAKLYYTIDEGLRSGAPWQELFFSRGGLTWYGGLIGAIAIGAIGCKILDLSILGYMNAVAVGTAVGQAIGRIGCFLVGDDYGRVTDVPWAVAFPQGMPPTLDPVHPTQIYEMIWLLAVAVLLWRRRFVSPFLFGEFMALNGLGRFFIEMLRVNPRVALGLTEPQWIAIGLIVLGTGGWMYYRSRPHPRAA